MTVIATAATTFITVTSAAVATVLPEAQNVFAPVIEGGNEYTIVAASLLLSLPVIGILTVLASMTRN